MIYQYWYITWDLSLFFSLKNLKVNLELGIVWDFGIPLDKNPNPKHPKKSQDLGYGIRDPRKSHRKTTSALEFSNVQNLGSFEWNYHRGRVNREINDLLKRSKLCLDYSVVVEDDIVWILNWQNVSKLNFYHKSLCLLDQTQLIYFVKPCLCPFENEFSRYLSKFQELYVSFD